MQNEPHEKQKCGAKNREGKPCGKFPIKGKTRCRNHGGKSTGTNPEKMKGNKNSIKTGEYETIWMDVLESDEITFLQRLKDEASGILQQLEQEIELATIRERRMMKRIKELQEQESLGDGHLKHLIISGHNDFGVQSEHKVKMIQSVEQGLTRVQALKGKLIEAKHRVQIAELDVDEDEDGDSITSLRDTIQLSVKLMKQKKVNE